MSANHTKIFSLAEANELVPLLADCTASVVQQLDMIRQRYQDNPNNAESSVPPEWVLKDVEKALREWSERAMELGVSPKGYFTVDFPTMDPEVLYCWTYGEEKITHTHKVWENFSHRRPIASALEVSKDHLRWVN